MPSGYGIPAFRVTDVLQRLRSLRLRSWWVGYTTQSRTRTWHRIRVQQCRLLFVKILLWENALIQEFFDLLETLDEVGIHAAGAVCGKQRWSRSNGNLSGAEVKAGVKRKVLEK
jgi:hypothetical protein